MLIEKVKPTNRKYILQATLVDKNNKAQKGLKPYETYNEQNTHFILIEPDINFNELYRGIVKFLNTKIDDSSYIDLDSFLKLVNKPSYEPTIYLIVRAAMYGSIDWLDKDSIIDMVDHKSPFKWIKKLTGAIENAVNSLNEITNETKIQPRPTVYTNSDLVYEIAVKADLVAHGQILAKQWGDSASNRMTPGYFEERIKANFAKFSDRVNIKVLYRDELEKKGMNLLVGVGQAAKKPDDQPRLVVIEYLNNPDSKELSAFVGKGVCFDTGGINIKTGNGMRNMKFDMCGAANSAAAVWSLAYNNVKTNVVAVLPLVLNLCDANALRPDDVLISYAKYSIEIDDTDAEGRLILADAIHYAAKDLKATEIISLATLTGTIISSLGETYTGVWATDDKTFDKLNSVASYAGELIWRMPFHNDYLEPIKSKVADYMNCTNIKPDSNSAAMFLKLFANGVKYTHFDIAGTNETNEQANGVMVATFYHYLASKWYK